MENQLFYNYNKLVKKHFGNHNSLKNFLKTINLKKINENGENYNDENEDDIDIIDYLNIPLLVRQVATTIYTDPDDNSHIIDTSYEINQKLMYNSYINHCLKEYKLKYTMYKKDKYLFYKFYLFTKIIKKNKNFMLPIELILEIKKYIF